MNVRVLGVFCFAVLAATLPARAAVPPQLSGMIGNWSCVGKVGGASETSTIAASAWGDWVKEEISFPAMGKYPASAGTAFLGWDATHKTWVYDEVDQVGEYFVTISSSSAFANSKWKAQYPPEAGQSKIVMLSKDSYTVDVTYVEGGKQMTFHQLCKRA